MRSLNISALDGANTAIRGKNDDGCESELESFVQVGETLDIEHVHFVDEQHTRNQLCDALVDVAVNNLVDFVSQLFRDFSLLPLTKLIHDCYDVVATDWFGVRRVQVVQCDVLYDFFPLVHVAFGSATYSSASKSNSEAYASLRPTRLTLPLFASM